jgi:hypothetical protein
MIMKRTASILMALVVVAAVIALTFWFSAEKKASETMAPLALIKAPDIRQRLAKFAPTEIQADPKLLSDEDRRVLNALIAAAEVIDEIFWKQASPQGLALRDRLERSALPEDIDYLRFLRINFGPFDRQDENRPFLGTDLKPSGAGFYPADLTKKEFEAYLAQNPAEREKLESSFTIVRRDNGKLAAVPYPEVYRAELEKIAGRLREAAALTNNPSLKAYLVRRADDLLSNEYSVSDGLWIDCRDNIPEIVIGPYEVYEDGLAGLKASYESYVYLNDREAMAKIRDYLEILPEMQAGLPVEPRYKAQDVRGLASPLNVVVEVFTAGDAKAGVQTSAFVLPNDETVREKKGTKKVFLKNMMEAKFRKCLVPIAARILAAEDLPFLTFDAFFTETLLHEISHALGVNYATLPDGTKITVNKALKERYSAVEEAKADAVGLANVPFLIQKGRLAKDREKEIYITYLAGMFRSLRFGATEAHGLGILLQFNFLREKKAFLFDEAAGRFRVDLAAIAPAVEALAREFLVLEGDGDLPKVEAFIARYGVLDAPTRAAIANLADIPVDIAPIFKTRY